jgi:hypothetical protein
MTFLWAFFMGFYNQYKIMCLSTLILLYCDGGTVVGLVETISAPSGVAAENTAAASSVRTAAASLGPACRRARSRRCRSFHLSSRLCFREFAALLRTLVKVKNDC